jgi:RNA polymerase sigma factor (sigma-70 family)
MTDWELLNQYVRERSNEAMGELVRRHGGMVHGVAMRELKDGALADDVTQAVFVVLMKRAETLSAKVVRGGWLFMTTMYAVADVRKKQRRRERHEREVARMGEKRVSAAAGVEEVMPGLDRAIAKLGEGDRQAIVLR